VTTRLGPQEEFRTLQRFVNDIEKQFLATHLTPAAASTLAPPTRQEELNVAAFAVLAHGAFENFVEGLGLWILDKMERSWVHKKRATRSAASILLYKPAPTGDMLPSVTVFDNLREALGEAKVKASAQIKDNNGIALSHLRALFRPLGVDVPEDTPLTDALVALVALRHRWAHQYRFGARTLTSARDAKKVVDECLKLAERLSKEAAAARP
jgi:hypothetical protein